MTADRASLGILGLIFSGVTAAVMLMAGTMVMLHLEGRLALDAVPTVVAALQ